MLRILKSKIFKVILVLIISLVGLGYYVNPYRETVSWNEIDTSLSLYITIERSKAIEDLDFLINKISKYHMSSLKSIPDEVLNQYKYEIENLPEKPRVLDVWISSSRITSKLQDAHSSVLYYGNENKLIEIDFEFNENLVQVKGGHRDGQILVGINEIAIGEVYERFISQFSHENIYYVQHNFPKNIVRKNQLNWLGINVVDEVELAFQIGEIVEKETYRLEDISPKYNNNENFIKYSINDENMSGILVLNSCIYNDEYKNTLREFFMEVKNKGIKHIALDLRENGGGNSLVANEFLRYLPIESYRDFGSNIRINSFSINNKPGISKNKRYEEYKDLVFHGALYVLTSKATFSSATMFTVLIADNDLGKIIGEPSGNKPSAYGDVLLFQMPNTKLPFIVTYKYFSRPDITKDLEDAIMPHYLINQKYAIDEFYRLITK